MNLRKALLLTLATTPLAGCYAHCIRIPDERFMIETIVSVEDFDAWLAETSTNATGPSACERICTRAYEERRGWRVDEIDACDVHRPSADDEEASGGFVTVSCRGAGVEYICKGRRPLGHVEQGPASDNDVLGATLAEMAELEAASVIAFEQLARQLRELDAPSELVERCHAAAEDERNHARWLGVLARRRGASLREPQLEAHTDDRLAIALHNASEGCVHESFAALVAALIAHLSPSPVLRRIYERIAVDETRHGQLAWDLHEWLHARLSTAERERVDAARREALARLPERVDWLAMLPREFVAIPPEHARQLARDFASALA